MTAVNGRSTGGGDNFFLTMTPTTGSAQFGCNRGGGSAIVKDGWLVTGDWIVTVAGCLSKAHARFEREGFDIHGQPAAIQTSEGGDLLRNARGTIDLVR